MGGSWIEFPDSGSVRNILEYSAPECVTGPAISTHLTAAATVACIQHLSVDDKGPCSWLLHVHASDTVEGSSGVLGLLRIL